jgi:hypothetical protein
MIDRFSDDGKQAIRQQFSWVGLDGTAWPARIFIGNFLLALSLLAFGVPSDVPSSSITSPLLLVHFYNFFSRLVFYSFEWI